MEHNKNFADLFGNNPAISLEERDRVIAELRKIGSLTFSIDVSGDGWIAQCKEIDGLIAANTNPTPSNMEIESQIREAVYTAFNVKFERVPSPLKFEYTVTSRQATLAG